MRRPAKRCCVREGEMRNVYLTLIAALLLMPHPALAQAPQPVQSQATTGTADIGPMLTTTKGDEARYERYRDLRDGAYTSLGLNRETSSYLSLIHISEPTRLL